MSRLNTEPSVAASAAQRLDKWLWYARVTKSRTLAATLIEGGKVRVNRTRTDKPSHQVRVGDVITATVHRAVRVLKVLEPGTRRGPASEAASLYEDLTPQPLDQGERASKGAAAGDDEAIVHTPVAIERAQGSGRPTKRDRRKLDRFRDGGL
jgi:ribosome-associated heat shock protein Hsp15